MTHSTRCFMAVALCLLGSASARADVVSEEPKSCPHGGEPSTCHAGPHCALTECESDTDCTASGTVCRELPVCVGKVVCAGLVPPDADLTAYERATVEGSCASGGSCPDESSCATKRICAPAARPASKEEDGGCAVSAVGRSRSPTLAIILALLLPALGISRRRRCPRAASAP